MEPHDEGLERLIADFAREIDVFREDSVASRRFKRTSDQNDLGWESAPTKQAGVTPAITDPNSQGRRHRMLAALTFASLVTLVLWLFAGLAVFRTVHVALVMASAIYVAALIGLANRASWSGAGLANRASWSDARKREERPRAAEEFDWLAERPVPLWQIDAETDLENVPPALRPLIGEPMQGLSKRRNR
ncbi:MAG: hypothetical protein M3198_15475 [Actinomycetota bacterium]|nr:hypothetical protein [Actinomycetota bacterium]